MNFIVKSLTLNMINTFQCFLRNNTVSVFPYLSEIELFVEHFL